MSELGTIFARPRPGVFCFLLHSDDFKMAWKFYA
jgi:hypothetical protein